MNKSIRIYILCACVAELASFLTYNATTFIRFAIVKPDNFQQWGNLVAVSTLAALFSSFVVQIICGLWLKKESKEIGGPYWLWFIFGFCFKWFAVGIFYLYTIYSKNNDSNQAAQVNPCNAPENPRIT